MTEHKKLTEPITLRAYAGKQKGKVWLTPVKDIITGKWLGIPEVTPEEERKLPRQWDPANPDFGRMISDGLELDPKSLVDVYDWDWIQYNKDIAFSLEEAQANEAQVVFYVDDPGREVRKRKELADKKFQAHAAIRNMRKNEKVDIMRYLGIPGSIQMDELDIDDILFQAADKDPFRIIEANEDPAKKDKLFIYALVDARKIKKDGYGAYRLGDILVGSNLEGAVLWLQDPRNRDIVARLFQELKQANPSLQKISVIEELEAEVERNSGKE